MAQALAETYAADPAFYGATLGAAGSAFFATGGAMLGLGPGITAG
jgi:hypothetical protein